MICDGNEHSVKFAAWGFKKVWYILNCKHPFCAKMV